MTDFSELLQPVIDLCEQAGQAIMTVYEGAGDMAVTYKSDDSPVTAADTAANALLMPGLRSLLPDAPVLSEEAEIPEFSERRQWETYWLVDPLDGTREFINRNGDFTVNVALIHRGQPVLGVVHAPVLQWTYTGLSGQGAYKYEQGERRAIQVRRLAALNGQPLEVVGSRRHGTEAVEAMVNRLRAEFGAVALKSRGSSLKFCLIAEGEADLYPRLAPTSEWDTAAAQAVVEAAGGAVYKDDMTPMEYNAKADLINGCFYVVGDRGYEWQPLLT